MISAAQTATLFGQLVHGSLVNHGKIFAAHGVSGIPPQHVVIHDPFVHEPGAFFVHPEQRKVFNGKGRTAVVVFEDPFGPRQVAQVDLDHAAADFVSTDRPGHFHAFAFVPPPVIVIIIHLRFLFEHLFIGPESAAGQDDVFRRHLQGAAVPHGGGDAGDAAFRIGDQRLSGRVEADVDTEFFLHPFMQLGKVCFRVRPQVIRLWRIDVQLLVDPKAQPQSDAVGLQPINRTARFVENGLEQRGIAAVMVVFLQIVK
ncbi:hypothetical protein D3C81_1141820 [compost metagenome]